MEDAKIIECYWNREEEALSLTQQVYGHRLHGLAVRFLEEEDAREAVNDTYLAAWNSIPPQRPAHLFAYLAKLCRNLCLNMLEKKDAAKRKAQVVSLTQEMEACLPDPRSVRRNEELGALLTEFLKAQSKQNRVIFMRRYWFGDEVQAIAQQCGMGQSAVKTSLHRTRQRLKKFLEERGVAL